MQAIPRERISRRHLCGSATAALCCLPFLHAHAARLADHPVALVEVAPGVYVSQGVHAEASSDNLGAIANIAFVVGGAAVAILDTGGCALWGRRLREAIASVTPLPVRYVINSHAHPDHIFGNAAFSRDRPTIIGHAKLPAALAARGPFYVDRIAQALGTLAEGTLIVPPDETVSGEREIDLGDRILRLTAYPTAHTDNDLAVLDVATSTLFPSDLVFMERTPALDGSLNGWLAVMGRLRQLTATRVIPGHGPAVADWPAALDAQERYLTTLRDEIRAMIAAGGTIEQAVATVAGSEREKWRLFDDYHPRNVVTAFTELEWE